MQKDIYADILAQTQLLMHEKTIEEITIREICSKSGISRQSFYNCFLDKYEVVEAIYIRDFGKFHSTLEQYDSLWTFFPKILENFYSDRKFYANAFKTYGQNSFREYCRKLLHPYLYKEFRSTFESDEQFDFFFKNFCEMTFSGIGIWQEKEPCPSPEQYSKELEQVILNHIKLQYSLLEKALNEIK